MAIPSQMVPGSMLGQPEKELVPVKFGTRHSLRHGVEVNQVVFRADLLIRTKAAGLYTDIAATKYQLSKEDLVYQVAAAYHGLLASREMVENA